MSERLGDEAFAAYLMFEANAELIRGYQPAVVPGLLQTHAYVRALLAPYSDPRARLERRIERQLLTFERLRDGLVRLEFIVQEAALKRPVGGDEVMAEQHEYLALMARTPGVSLTVIPMAAGPHRGLNGAFTLLSAKELTAVYTEGLWTDTLATGSGARRDAERLWAELEPLAVPWEAMAREEAAG